MAVPTVITDCSATAASNSPAGSDSIGTSLDDFLRIHSALARQIWDIATVYAATVGGTANAITLTPTMALTAYKTGQRIAFKATGTSSGTVTINTSGVGAKKAFSSDGTTQLTTGDIVSGKYYTFIYDSTLDTAAGGFMLDGSATQLLSLYATIASPAFTGNPTAPTQAAGDSSTKLATTAFVNSTALTLATGSTAVTQSASDNSTKVATTAYADRLSPSVGALTNTTSGTTVTIGSIPAGVKRIHLNFNQVSTNGTSNLLVQLGTGGGIESSGYVSASSVVGGTTASSTAGFIINENSASNQVCGTLTLNLMDSATNLWAGFGIVAASAGPGVFTFSGIKPLAAAITQVRLTTVGGADTFDNGSINLTYEY